MVICFIPPRRHYHHYHHNARHHILLSLFCYRSIIAIIIHLVILTINDVSCFTVKITTKSTTSFIRNTRIIHNNNNDNFDSSSFKGFHCGFSNICSKTTKGRRGTTCLWQRQEEEEEEAFTFFEEEHRRKEYLATCIPGLATVLRDELISILGDDASSSVTILSNAAVSFSSSSSSDPHDHAGLKALLWLRTAHRILEKIDTFRNLETRDDVYDSIQQSPNLNVKEIFGDGKGDLLSLSVKVILNVNNNHMFPKDISHSHYTALTIKNAFVDQIRQLRDDGSRPNVDTEDPDVPFVAILHNNLYTNTADMTLYRSLAPPGSLHKRGYRRNDGPIHKAAMKESLAAGLLLSAGWSNQQQQQNEEEVLYLIDPMCGSGSLLMEALLMTMDYAPGLLRIKCNMVGSKIPPILRWKSNQHLRSYWKELLLDATKRFKSAFFRNCNRQQIRFVANDIHPGALDLLQSSLNSIGLPITNDSVQIKVYQNDCKDWDICHDLGLHDDNKKNARFLIVSNPPWGIRLTDNDHESWESLRIFLRNNCIPGSTMAWVLSGNKSATKHLGLKRSNSIPFQTGQQNLRWIQYYILNNQKQQQQQQREDNYTYTDSLKQRIISTRRTRSSSSSSRKEPKQQQKEHYNTNNRVPSNSNTVPERKRYATTATASTFIKKKTIPDEEIEDSWY